MQKFWNLNEQRQAVARIHHIGQMRTPKSWILHCEGGVDDRADELHQSRGKFEAWVMHRLIGEKFSYMQLMDTRATRIRELEQAQFATQASAAVPGPSGIQGGHQQNVKTTPGPPRGVMVPLVLLVYPDPP